MAQDLVTLEHPDGRRYRTDSASEINLLVGSYGYRRVEQESSSKSARANKSAAKPTPPTSAPAEQPPPEASSS